MNDASSLVLIPYPELKAEVSGSSLSLTLPWLSITADVDPVADRFARFCVQHLHDPSCKNEISTFLAPFAEYPVAFMRLREYVPEDEDERSTGFDILAYSATSKEAQYDGIAALSCLRRKLLVSQAAEVASGSAPRQTLGREVARKAVFQNYYVTSNCDRILAAAENKFNKCGDILTEFRRDETGHDKLLKRVVDQIGPCPGGVLEETKRVVSLLEVCAEAGILPLALALEVFEGIEFTVKESPLANLVRANFGDEAARPLQIHYDINRSKKHGRIGLEVLSTAPLVSKSEIMMAEKLANDFDRALSSLNRAIFEFA